MAGALLVVSHTDHGYDDAQDDAQDQRHGRDIEGRSYALDVLEPAVGLNKCLIEFHEKRLPEAQISAGGQDRLPLGIELLQSQAPL